MPFKDPERKRQWERDNRDRRNAQRRNSYFKENAPDPVPEKPSTWKFLFGVLVFVGLTVLIGITGVTDAIPDIQT